MNPPWLRETAEGVYLSIKLQPRAPRNQVGEPLGAELKISITAPPVDSAANQALLEFLASRLGRSKSAVQLVRGQTSRHKTIFVRGATAASVVENLQRG